MSAALTPVQDVYKFFLARIQSDEWLNQDDIDIYEREWRDILDMARFPFRYPRKNIGISEDGITFLDTLGEDEIQVLSVLMKQEWLKRCVSSMENLRQGYDERDWKRGSRANHLDKLIKYQEAVKSEAKQVLYDYSRSEGYKPSKIFSEMAGKSI